MLRIISCLLVSLLLLLSPSPAQATPLQGQVIWWSDADTAKVKLDSGIITNLRVACIDAPEVPHTRAQLNTKNPNLLNHYQWGSKALAKAKELIPLKSSVNVLPVSQDYRYSRTVGELILPDGSNLAQVLLSQGLVKIYDEFLNLCPDKNELIAAQNSAQQSKVGIWGDANYLEAKAARSTSTATTTPTPTPTLTNTATGELPECVGTDCDCKDFDYQNDAQVVLNAFPDDRFDLDRDRDGDACEKLRRRSGN